MYSDAEKLPTANHLDKSKGDGEDIDWDHFIDWDTPACRHIVQLAYHVCLNGPVHVRKRKLWPGLKGAAFSIVEKFKEAGYPKPVTDALWKKFCEVVSKGIDYSLDSVRESYTIKTYGKLWPSCAEEFAVGGLFQMIRKVERKHYGSVNEDSERDSEKDMDEDCEEDGDHSASE